MLLAKALTALVSELERVGVEYAVVGGLAASARGEVRFTRDIDVAVATRNDADAERLMYQLSRRGYSVSATVEQERTGRLATARLRNADHVVCDLIFATSGIEVEVVSSAEPLELFPGSVVKAAAAEALLAMKILSATPQRPRDLGDIQAIVNANSTLSEPMIEQLLQLIVSRWPAAVSPAPMQFHCRPRADSIDRYDVVREYSRTQRPVSLATSHVRCKSKFGSNSPCPGSFTKRPSLRYPDGSRHM